MLKKEDIFGYFLKMSKNWNFFKSVTLSATQQMDATFNVCTSIVTEMNAALRL